MADDFWSRLIQEAARGGRRGWNPNDPIGYDPQTKARHRQAAAENPFLAPVQGFNDLIGYRAVGLADAGLRGLNAAAHATATTGGQLVNEIAGTSDRRGERDIMMLMQMLGARAGRPGTGAAVSGLGRSSANTAKKGAGSVHREYYTRRLAKELGKADPQTTGFGKIAPRLLSELNTIRRIEGEPPIGTRDINVYANVLKKFQDKRLGLDGLTPRQVAQTIYRVVHGDKTVVQRGKHPTSALMYNEDGPGVAVGYAGRGPQDDVSVKSTMRVGQKRLEKLKKR